MKALLKEFWMEIRTSRTRFLSIFFIVAMGVAFYSGIWATAPDMRISSDAYYDGSQLMDLKVIGTMGLTEEDVQALLKVNGVESAEGAYATDVLCGKEESQTVIHVESINETMNQFQPQEGRLPQKSGECYLDQTYAGAFGYQVGDTIEFRQTQDSKLLKKETYTITGIGSSVLYISFMRGNSTLGSGEVNGFAYVLPEDFDQEVYTQIYLQVRGAEELISYTEEYDTLIEEIQENVEGIQKQQSELRYHHVVSEAQAELDDARREYEDAKEETEEELAKAEQELKDGEQELEEGRQEYEDGKKEYEDGKKQLEDARKEIEDGKSQLAAARQELSSGQQQLNAAKAQVSAGWTEIAAAKEELASGQAQIDEAQTELDAGYKQLSCGKKEIENGKKQLEQAKTDLTARESELVAAKEQITAGRAELESNEVTLTEQKTSCEAGLAQVEAGEAQLLVQKETLTGTQSALSAKQQQYDSAVSEGILTEEELAVLAADLETIRIQEQELSAAVSSYEQQLAAQRTELETGLAALEAGFLEIEQKKAELDAVEAELVSGQEQIEAAWEELSAKGAELSAAETELAESQAQLDAGQVELNSKKAELSAAHYEITVNEQSLAEGEAEIASSEWTLTSGEAEITANEEKLKEAEQTLADAEQELADGEKELADGWAEYEDGKKQAEEEFADAEQELVDAQKEIDDIQVPEWYVTDRSALPEYSGYGDNAERIRSIGEIFPWLFFLVAALISLTTMTRMVEEQRTQIGTMKALGYGKFAIAFKYLGYAVLATAGGSIVGVLIGEKIFPWVIIKAYGIMYQDIANVVQTHYEWKYALTGSCAALLCTVGATLFSCYKTLLETPASLMRPPAPKKGKRTLLERIPILWKHLSFSWKSTLRNMFRYKKRLCMTVFGIAGSMGLMLIGFGINDSIMGIPVLQYKELQHYDGIVIHDEEASKEEREELLAFMEADERIRSFTSVQMSAMTVPNGKKDLSVYIYVPENLEKFSKDITLKNRKTDEIYTLTEEGAAVSEKTAAMLNLQIGDLITIEKQQKQYQVKISVITENYMGHYIYMSPKVYEETFGEKAECPDLVFTVNEEAKEEMEGIGNKILTYPAALSISYTASAVEQVERMLGTLGMVVVVLIISAGMLAFVVLYNLNNINITERQRELATLKVLGFYDSEVSMYVFRENIILTILGILAGCGLGLLLHRFIIVTVEVDTVMFGRNVNLPSFIYCAVLTGFFSLFVNGVMHFKLKKINMVESLKSVE